MKKNKKPGIATPAPAKKAENKKTTNTVTVNHIKRDLRKEAEARSRARRMRSMLKLGMEKERIEELFANEDNRMILVLLNGKYTVQDGMRKKKVKKEMVEEPNILRGFAAAKKYVDDNNLNFVTGTKVSMWIRSNKDQVDNEVELLKVLGRVSVTKPEKHTKATEEARMKKERKTPKTPTNNTAEVKKAAKAARKEKNKNGAEMRAYYAALRKGGVNARIKKHNPTLAKKIETWLKDRKKTAETKADAIDKHKRDHRQMSSIEMKANKRSRKAIKFIIAKERRMATEKKRAEYNAKVRAERAQKAQKPVQTKLKMAA